MDDPAGVPFFQKIKQAPVSFGTVVITGDHNLVKILIAF